MAGQREFVVQFGTEEQGIEHLAGLRWPGGEGILPKRLQELLGHTTLAMTMDTYGHLFPAGEAEKNRINNAYAAVFVSDTKLSSTLSISSAMQAASADISIMGT